MGGQTTPTRSDTERFLATIRALRASPHAALRGFFRPGQPTLVARAPGRLDVMGGIADYSGSLVLQLPLAEAAFAAVQRADDGVLRVCSLAPGAARPPRVFTTAEEEFEALCSAGYDEARRFFAASEADHWAAYVLGPLLVLDVERGARPGGGLRVLIDSHVPEGKGVSSSAALEVAAMQALAHLLGDVPGGAELARLCQLAENCVAGAPCGIMDQMTAALGRADELLALLCQPAEVRGFVPLPDRVAVWGIDSGIRHAVSGSDYTSVRVGAFMGYRMIAGLAGLEARGPGRDGLMTVDDPRWDGYLANLSPDEFADHFQHLLPEAIRGGEFLDRCGGSTDPVTRVDPARTYAVRRPTAHPIFEHARVRKFAQLLRSDADDKVLTEMGRLMFGSHASYSACGLGSEGTDRLVELVREAGAAAGLYGAKITGGGSGGTVAVLGRADAGQSVARIARQYARETSRPAAVFSGSSEGACGFGVRVLET